MRRPRSETDSEEYTAAEFKLLKIEHEHLRTNIFGRQDSIERFKA